MDTSRLATLLNLLAARDAQFRVQERLSTVRAILDQLKDSPANPQIQSNFAVAFAEFQKAHRELVSSFDPAETARLAEIGADEFFVADLPSQIADSLSTNQISPNVVFQNVNKMLQRRDAYLTSIAQLRERLKEIGVVEATLNAGQAEIGFKIPRPLFHDNLDGLIPELREIRFIIRAFSEAVHGRPESAIVRTITTTDPLFFFGLSPETIAAIASAVSWILDTWETVENIRKVREETKNLKLKNSDALITEFDRQITSSITAGIAARVSELVPITSDSRSNELQNHMGIALNSLFARIERGMTIEVRFLPPAAGEGLSETRETTEAFDSLSKSGPQLVFPEPSEAPILALPRSGGDTSEL